MKAYLKTTNIQLKASNKSFTAEDRETDDKKERKKPQRNAEIMVAAMRKEKKGVREPNKFRSINFRSDVTHLG